MNNFLKKLLKSQNGATEILEVAILLVFVIFQIAPSIINVSKTVEKLLQVLDEYLKSQMAVGINQ
ncbi:hypothetical protein [Caldicellulosiruptor morganii]|uniref:Flagellin Flp1-like domain-containing protein n=1 Tax=Caldicellulosiruptor morganii TaxID=1387555 RepID=A0ABY7BLD0_9FIRM|nr:hypothetical protein [Caldicellulosiruptor morganii]WAM33305.1 hypothetical protein OTK00_001800 [Caldicellulosiruptor morganii]